MRSLPELIRGCKSIDRLSQSRWYNLLSPTFCPVCCRYCKNQKEAEEVMQVSSGVKTSQTATVNGRREVYLAGTLGLVAKYQLHENFSLFLMPHQTFH